MTNPTKLKYLFAAVTLSCALSPAAFAGLIVNGGFESGFSNWTRANQLGSEGAFALQTGIISPVNGDPVPLPPGAITAAMTDAFGPGAHVLYQDFTVPTPVAAGTLMFQLFIGNRAGTFSTPSPATLDFSTPALNQQARVDILLAGTDPFSVASSDVLFTAFQTSPGNPAISGYTAHNVDVTAILNAHVGGALRLRFAETDNVFTFQLGVDNADIVTGTSAVPEPSTWLLTLGALALAGGRIRRRRLG